MPAVLYEVKNKVAHLTLNRPDVMNAINSEMWDGLVKAWIDMKENPDVWVGLVTGAGERAFCAGADLKEMTKLMAEGKTIVPDAIPMRGMELWKPVIAAINGICTGGGLELAMACDIRIAADNARLGLADVRQSLIPGASGTQKLPRLVPFGKALEILLTGDFIDAQEAYRIGLVNKVVPAAELISAAEALANRISENGPLAVRAAKESAYRGIQMPLNEALHMELLIVQGLLQTEDAKEGPRAFAEKRKPNYQAK